MTIRLPQPARDPGAIKKTDQEYRDAQLYILRQSVPGEVDGPAPDDVRAIVLFSVMSAEGYFTEVEPNRYAITEKGIDYRNRLQRPTWWQWLLDNKRWVVPTIVAIASIICAVIIGITNCAESGTAMTIPKPKQVWELTDAQANLPEVLRLAESEGPQYIGAGQTFVVAPAEPEQDRDEPKLTLGQWLVENAPRGTNLEIPDDEPPEDKIPWTEEVD